MISYLVITLPWTLGCIALSPPNPRAVKYRKRLAAAFFGTLVPLVYFFLQHKVHRIPGGTEHPGPTPRSQKDRANAARSLHHLRALRVGPHPLRRRLRRRDRARLLILGGAGQGYQGPDPGVRLNGFRRGPPCIYLWKPTSFESCFNGANIYLRDGQGKAYVF